jgi:hypothetical protein
MVSRSLPPQGTDHQSKQIAELETPAELANCRTELERCSCLILFAFRDEACDGLRVLHAVSIDVAGTSFVGVTWALFCATAWDRARTWEF